MRPGIFAAALLCLAVAYYSFTRPELPLARGVEAPPTEFSAARAMRLLRVLARESRATGTPGLERARQTLLREFAALGLRAEIHEGTAGRAVLPGLYSAARVKNILVRLPRRGRANAAASGAARPAPSALLLMAHLDSVPNGPGANDDAAGVAVLCEVARALRAGPPPARDVYLLFTDAEERGMLGSLAFFRTHPAAREIGAVINVEARGRSGLPLLFETGESSGVLVRLAEHSTERAAGGSVAAALTRFLPYGTDFEVFRDAGIPGLNFAYVDGVLNYHSALDNVASVDPRSVQQHGDQVLGIVRALSADSKLSLRGADRTYGNALGSFWSYPADCDPWLMLAAAVLVVLVLGRERLAARVTGRGVLFGALAPLLAILAAAGSAWVAWLVLRFVHPQYEVFFYAGETYNARDYKIALAALSLAAAALCYALRSRRVTRDDVLVGALCCLGVSAMIALRFAPGAAHIFSVPALALGAALLLARARHRVPAVVLFAGTVTLALYAPLVRHLVFSLFGLSSFAAGVFFLILPAVPVLALLSRRTLLVCAAGMVLCAGGLVARAATQADFSPARPRPTSAFYLFDFDHRQAYWFSCDPRPDEWTTQILKTAAPGTHVDDFVPFLGRCLPGAHRARGGAAPVVDDLLAPELRVVRHSRTERGPRRIQVYARSRRAAPGLYVFWRGAAAATELRVNGVPVEPSRRVSPLVYRWLQSYLGFGEWQGVLYASSGDPGLDLEITLPPADFELRVVDHSYELPAARTLRLPPRPRDTMPGLRYPYADGVFVYRSVKF